nr:GNAT family N-acetyltransferase [uncultured Sphingomonas sp.]
MSVKSLARAVGTSHPAARDPQHSRLKPRLLVMTNAPLVSPMSGRPLDEVDEHLRVVLETERLILRPMVPSDFPAYFAMMADAESFAFAHRGPFSSDEAWTRFLRQSGHWQLLGYGPFAVFEKATGTFVGEVGFGDFRRGLGGEFDYCPEASWTIVKDARRQGYATEAIKAAVEWMEEHRGSMRTVCIIHSRNRSSLRIAHKLGFKPFRYAEYRGAPSIFFKRTMPGYEK